MRLSHFVEGISLLNYCQTSDPEEAFILGYHPDWHETTATSDPPGTRTFQRFVTVEIDDDVPHIPPKAVYPATLTIHSDHAPLIALTGEYCDQ